MSRLGRYHPHSRWRGTDIPANHWLCGWCGKANFPDNPSCHVCHDDRSKGTEARDLFYCLPNDANPMTESRMQWTNPIWQGHARSDSPVLSRYVNYGPTSYPSQSSLDVPPQRRTIPMDLDDAEVAD